MLLELRCIDSVLAADGKWGRGLVGMAAIPWQTGVLGIGDPSLRSTGHAPSAAALAH